MSKTSDRAKSPKSPARAPLNMNPKETQLKPEALGDQVYMPFGLKLIMTEDLNAAERLFGGKLLAWVDEYAALYCMNRLQTRQIVTKKISEVIFNEPAHLGDILKFLFRTKQVGTSSITTECLVTTMPIGKNDIERIVVRCDVVFVALDRNGRPIPHHYVEADPAAQDK